MTYTSAKPHYVFVRNAANTTTIEPLSSSQLPAALAAGGGLKVEGVVGGVAQPVSLAALPAMAAEIIDITLSLDTVAYAIGDVLAATQEVANFVSVVGGRAYPVAVQITDDDGQGGAFDLLFFRSLVDIGTENVAYDITDAEMLEYLGRVVVAAGDYTDWTNNKTAMIRSGDIGWKLGILGPAAATRSLWVAAISRDTKTYTAAGLKIKVHLMY